MSAENVGSLQRGKVLDMAKKIINGERQDQYGNPEDSFRTIAGLWNAYLSSKRAALARRGILNKPDELFGYDVANMMALLKIARQLNGSKLDNFVDACGYLALSADMVGVTGTLTLKEDTND